jgi:DNA-binding MarR family transcriptional regulator
VTLLVGKGHVARQRDKTDRRVTWVAVTRTGRKLLHHIDEQVQIHVDYFTRTLTPAECEAALSILMFYVGISLKPSRKSTSQVT